MRELATIADTFGTSEPIFVISLDNSGDLDFKVKNKYVPPKDHDDPVVAAVANVYTETLDKRAQRFISSIDTRKAYGNMIRVIRDIVLNANPLKNPKQSRLFKWLCDGNTMYNNSQCSDGFVALYRYICSVDIVHTRSHTDPHAMNVIAILELMRKKYE